MLVISRPHLDAIGGPATVRAVLDDPTRPVCVFDDVEATDPDKDLPEDWFQFHWRPAPTGSLQVLRSVVLALSTGRARPLPPHGIVFAGRAATAETLSRFCLATRRFPRLVAYRAPADDGQTGLGTVVLGQSVATMPLFPTFCLNLHDSLGEDGTRPALDVLRAHTA